MSQQMRNGYGFDFPVPAGQSMLVSSITGTYTATIVAGPGKGTALATDSTGGGTYGPYSGGVVIRLQAGANSLIDYDIAVSPALTYAGPLNSGYNSSGDVASAVDGDGNVFGVTPSNIQKMSLLGPKPIGFNYYSMVADLLQNASNNNTYRPLLLADIAASGANMVRVMLPCFSSGDYLTLVHSTASMPATMQDSNVRASFTAGLDTCMDELAALGLKMHACYFWTQAALPSAFGESNAVGYGSTSSLTYSYAVSAIQWFFRRYKNHPAFGVFSMGNEWLTDAAGITNPTPAQLGAWFAGVAAAGRVIRADKIITADLQTPSIATTATRETIDQFAARLLTLTAGLDAINVHVYGNTYNYVGANATDNAAFPNNNTTTLGYEGLPALMRTVRAIADSVNKPLIIGEYGVSTDDEADASFLKKRKMTKSVAANASYSLIWNVQDATRAVSSSQQTWCIDRSTTRMATFKAIALEFNTAKVAAQNIPAAVKAGLRTAQPEYAMQTTRTAGARLTVASTAAHGSASGYGAMFWMRWDSVLNAFEGLIDTRNSTTAGLYILGSSSAGNTTLYSDGRYASGGAGNTSGYLPDFGTGEFVHVAHFHVMVNGAPAIQMYLNGLFWKTVSATALPATIPAATNLYFLGGSTSGAPVSMQDIALVAGFSPDDIWRHMRGEVVPGSLLHIRGLSNGRIVDLSANNVAVTVGAGVSVVAV